MEEKYNSSIDKKNSDMRRARLAALISIGSKNYSKITEPQEILQDALSKPAEGKERRKLLIFLFTKYIPGGWKDDEPQDQQFLLKAPIQNNSFWFDW